MVEVVAVYTADIGMEFEIEKCAVVTIERGVKEHCQGIVLPSGEVMKEVDENGYRYLGVLVGAGIMNKEMKKKAKEEYLRRVKLVARSRLYAGNLIKGVNASGRPRSDLCEGMCEGGGDCIERVCGG